MKKNEDINNIEQTSASLWKKDGRLYRLFGKGITPNGCWIIGAYMKELKDIEVATGNDVYGNDTLEFDLTGTVPACYEYITV